MGHKGVGGVGGTSTLFDRWESPLNCERDLRSVEQLSAVVGFDGTGDYAEGYARDEVPDIRKSYERRHCQAICILCHCDCDGALCTLRSLLHSCNCLRPHASIQRTTATLFGTESSGSGKSRICLIVVSSSPSSCDVFIDTNLSLMAYCRHFPLCGKGG
jgi:hypothetical protein